MHLLSISVQSGDRSGLTDRFDNRDLTTAYRPCFMNSNTATTSRLKCSSHETLYMAQGHVQCNTHLMGSSISAQPQ